MRDCELHVAKYQRDEVRLPSESRKDIFKRAETNCERVKDGLAAHEDPTPIGQYTQGSYAMHAMIVETHEDCDLDDGVYFRKEDLVGSMAATKHAGKVDGRFHLPSMSAAVGTPKAIRAESNTRGKSLLARVRLGEGLAQAMGTDAHCIAAFIGDRDVEREDVGIVLAHVNLHGLHPTIPRTANAKRSCLCSDQCGCSTSDCT